MSEDHAYPKLVGNFDPYLAYLKDYFCGSNGERVQRGNTIYDTSTFDLHFIHVNFKDYAGRYIHYLHGVNPLGLVYLSNMYNYGAERSVNEFYHSWYTDGSPNWDRVGVSKYGPPPGFLTGGPNPKYKEKNCCSTCADAQDSTRCPSPPSAQPAQKSYKDFNADWPLNSWEATENHNIHQAAYIRLLSKFVK